MADPYRRREQNDNAMHPTLNPIHQQSSQDAMQHRRNQQAGGPSEMDPQRNTLDGSRTLDSNINQTAYGGYYQGPPTAGFATSASHTGSMNYHQPAADYGQDTRQTQGFVGAYGTTAPGMIYSVQQPGGQSSVFDPTQTFPPRQHSGMQMMATDMNPSPYYPGDAQATAAMHAHGGQSGPAPAVYQPHQNPPGGRPGMVSGYTGGIGAVPITEPLASHPMAGASQEQTAVSLPTGAVSSGDYTKAPDALASYRETLRQIFNSIKNGSLAPAAESLLGISDWLLSRVESLGLATDNEELLERRLKLWSDFNNAWLSLLEKQKAMMCSESSVHPPQSLVSLAELQRMAREILRLCDSIEPLGLVDYDYGVWEERIVTSITECVDIYTSGVEGVSGSSGSQQG